jgi:sec-independent protein translocase protein TatB
MFDVGFWELILIFGVGLMILGPERMPRVASQIGRWIGRARRTASSLRRQLEQEIASADAPPPPPRRKPTPVKPVNRPAPEKPEAGATDDGEPAPAPEADTAAAPKETAGVKERDSKGAADGDADGPTSSS